MKSIYATFDAAALDTSLMLEQSNTVVSHPAAAVDIHRMARALQGKSFGAWYAEMMVWGDDPITNAASLGIVKGTASLAKYVGEDGDGWGYRIGEGQIHNAGASVATVDAGAKGDTIGILLNLVGTAPAVTWFRNGVLLHSQALTDLGPWYLAATVSGASAFGLRCFLNTGARAFDYPNVNADGWYELGDIPTTVLMASEDWMSAPTDDPANMRYVGRIAADADLVSARSLDFWPWQRGVSGQTATFEVLDGADDLLELLTHDARDLSVAIADLYPGDAYAYRYSIMHGFVDNVQAKDDLSLRITLRDGSGMLEQPAQRRLISPAADPAAANKPWPVCLGACRTVAPVLIDAATLTYAVHDGQVLGLGYVRDMGDPLDPSASPADYAQTADKHGITLHVAPAGKLTVDASSIGGAGVPGTADDVLGGKGAPFLGPDNAPPTDFDDVGSNQAGGAPTMQSGKLVFPHVVASPTVKVGGWLATNGFGGSGNSQAFIRISWRDKNGNELSFVPATAVVGTTAYTYYEVTSSAPAGAWYAVAEAAVTYHYAGTVDVDDMKAWYVTSGGDVAIAIKNPGFEDGGTGWTSDYNSWSITNAAGAHAGSWHAHRSAGGQPHAALRNGALIPIQGAAPTISWAGITTAKLGTGKSYQLLLTVPAMPDVSGTVASRVGIATGKTPDTYLWSTDKPGTYSVAITNTTGADVSLYLLAVTAPASTATVTSTTVDTWQVQQFDDTYVPPVVGDPSAPSDLMPITLSGLMTELLDRRRADLDIAWSKSDTDAIDTATGYAGVGIHFADGETVREVLRLALDSYTACMWQDNEGTLRVTRLVDPATVDEADIYGVLDVNAMREDLLIVPDLAPGLTTQFGVRRNWSPLGDSDFVSNYTSVPLQLRRALKAPFQETRATNAALNSAYIHAQSAPAFASVLDDPANGQAEIDRVGELYTVRRTFYQVKLEWDAVAGIDLGQVWTLTYPRYGLEMGKPVMVIDIVESRLAGTIDAILWG